MSNRNQYQPDTVSPPGETLREALEERGISQAEFASRTGRPKKTISEIMNGHAAITPETALQFELVLSIPAQFWISREQHYREYLARRRQESALQKARTWCKNFPLAEMAKLGWIDKPNDPVDRVKETLGFYGVASPGQWEIVCKEAPVAYRTPPKFPSDPFALSAWLRQGVREAATIPTAPYNKDKFKSALGLLRRLTTEPPEVFCHEVTTQCAQAGVAVVYIPELKRSRASGATRWLTPHKAVIQLSLRYKTTDQLWFTFFHEAAHILLHEKKKIYVEDGGGSSKQEEEADAFAANSLIPDAAYRDFCKLGKFTSESVRQFAQKIGIAPGIVVGRLQHDRQIPFRSLNSLKARLNPRSFSARKNG